MVATGSWMRSVLSFLVIGIMTISCNPNRNTIEKVEMNPCPKFSADSAYNNIVKQLNFGVRVPGTDSHSACGDFLVSELTVYGATVTEQRDSVIAFDGTKLPLRNIIASFSSQGQSRIMLCAHWDSRAYADQDPSRPEEPIPGANDGASGVAVLLEIARCMALQAPGIGVDIVLFDVEDQGAPSFLEQPTQDHGYCLGSRYWSENLTGSKPLYGILLDMVGAKNAVFTLEGTSMKYAERVMRKVWDVGNQIGYADRFRYNLTRHITDDHTNVNEIAGIQCIDIIQYDSQTLSSFGPFWHTHNDNIDVIDRNTLKAVGQTVTQVVYNE